MDCEHTRLTYTNEVKHDGGAELRGQLCCPDTVGANKHQHIKLDGNLLKAGRWRTPCCG